METKKTCPKKYSYKAILRQTFFLHLQSEHFPFLGTHTTRAYKDMRSRTTFYIALGRLLMVDLGEDEDKFESFMAPITSKLSPTLVLSVIIVNYHFSGMIVANSKARGSLSSLRGRRSKGLEGYMTTAGPRIRFPLVDLYSTTCIPLFLICY